MAKQPKDARLTLKVKVGFPFLKRATNRIEIAGDEIVSIESEFVDRLISRLQKLQNRYKNTYDDLSIEGRRECYCEGSCDCHPTYYLMGTREETDLEYNFRMKELAAQKSKREAGERAEFERLKKKFETR